MKKFFAFLFLVSIIISNGFLFTTPIHATVPSCGNTAITLGSDPIITFSIPPNYGFTGNSSTQASIIFVGVQNGNVNPSIAPNSSGKFNVRIDTTNNTMTINDIAITNYSDLQPLFDVPGTITYMINLGSDGCEGTIAVGGGASFCNVQVSGNFQFGQTVYYQGSVSNYGGKRLYVKLVDPTGNEQNHVCGNDAAGSTQPDGGFGSSFVLPTSGSYGQWTVQVYDDYSNSHTATQCTYTGDLFCQASFTIQNTSNPGGEQTFNPPAEICQRLGADSGSCVQCLAKSGIWTAVGCVPIGNVTSFIIGILKFAVGIGGGLTFLLIVYGGFKMLTSRGNPEGIAEAREIITNAIAGLLLIIFSAVILKIIGVDILQIPGFGS